MSEPTPADLLGTWDRWSHLQNWRYILAGAETSGDLDKAAMATRVLTEAAPASALDALAANARLVDLMTGWRWLAIKDARQQGATWEQVGNALGLSKQGAEQAYRRAIEHQEKYAPDFHNGDAAAAARAAL